MDNKEPTNVLAQIVCMIIPNGVGVAPFAIASYIMFSVSLPLSCSISSNIANIAVICVFR